jgi:flagellin
MPVISTNTASNTALRYLNTNSDMQSGSLAKIASGRRIERASDDAAGLAVSTKLRSNISVLEQAAINADQGISVLQTADGALARMDDILQRMSTLAAQSINGGVDDATRAFIDAEFQQLVQELDDIASATNFNGGALLNGSYNEEFLLGTNGGVSAASTNRLSIDLGDFRISALKGYASVSTGQFSTGGASGNTYDYSNPDATLNSITGLGLGANAANIVIEVGTDDAAPFNNISTLDSDYESTTINLGAAGANITGSSSVQDLINAINDNNDIVRAGVDVNGQLVLTSTRQGLSMDAVGLNQFSSIGFGSDTLGSKPAATFTDVDGDRNGAGGEVGDTVSVRTIGDAEIAFNILDGAIFQIAQARAEVGAQISRFEFRADVIDASIENLTAANSAILDADIAEEQTGFTSYATLTEAAIAALAAANDLPSKLLRLLQ